MILGNLNCSSTVNALPHIYIYKRTQKSINVHRVHLLIGLQEDEALRARGHRRAEKIALIGKIILETATAAAAAARRRRWRRPNAVQHYVPPRGMP